jgi:hypothetical protein
MHSLTSFRFNDAGILIDSVIVCLKLNSVITGAFIRVTGGRNIGLGSDFSVLVGIFSAIFPA